MSQTGDTLEQAINNENGVTGADKTTQLGFLGTAAKGLYQSDIEGIISGDHSQTAETVGELKSLVKWRIENDKTVLPFTNLDLGSLDVHPFY